MDDSNPDLYAFRRKQDLEALLRMLNHGDRTPPERQLPTAAIFLTPEAGIPARSGTTVGYAECELMTLMGHPKYTLNADEWKLNFKKLNPEYAVKDRVGNIFSTAVGGNKYVIATRVIFNAWVVISEDC